MHLTTEDDRQEDNYIKPYPWKPVPVINERLSRRHFNSEYKMPTRRINRAAPPSLRSRGSYNKRRLELSLCHFKICNMKLSNGRKRATRFAKPRLEFYDYNYDD